MATLERALIIAAQAHEGTTDKGGAPYILHPLRLMHQMTTTEERIVALLHDVVEDSHWTLDDLRAEGFSEEIVAAVDGLTRREGETYDDFIARGASNPLARRVKLADIEDNMDVRRLGEIGEKDLERLQRYQRARKAILTAIGERT